MPVYQIVVADSRSPRDGKFLEVVGHYQPTLKPHSITLKKDRVEYWMHCGAQPTATVNSLIRATGLLYELRMKKLGRSEADIATEMEKWEAAQMARREKRVTLKARRRRAKKEAEAASASSAEG